jgi:DNA-binding CsgD family transcriptional regulator
MEQLISEVRVGGFSGYAGRHAAEESRAPRAPISDDRVAAMLGVLLDDPFLGVIVAEPPHRVSWTNAVGADMLTGNPKEVLIGRRLTDLFPEDMMREIGVLAARQTFGSQPPVLRVIWNDRELFIRVAVIGASEPEERRTLVLQLRWATLSAADAARSPAAPPMVESLVARYAELARLTPRELEVLAMVGQGMSIREIAEALFRSEKTVQNHRDAVGTKLGLHNRVELAAVARRAGLTMDDAARMRV